jgi:hypothetical protein
MKVLTFGFQPLPATSETAMIPAFNPVSLPDALPPSFESLEGVLVLTLFIRTLTDFIKSVQK